MKFFILLIASIICVTYSKVTFSSPPTSLTLSPTGEFLATSHVGRLGISMWCDKSFFSMVHLDGATTEPFKMNEPCPVAECEQEGASSAILDPFLASSTKKHVIESTDNGSVDDFPPIAKEDGLITLSGLPPAHWKNLFHLELVKERNKPTEAPQKPPQAPFFLQWRAGLTSGPSDNQTANSMKEHNKQSTETGNSGWDAVWSDDDHDDNENIRGSEDIQYKQSSEENTASQKKRMKVVHERTRLAEMLRSCASKDSFSDITLYLSTMGPSAIDVELSSLCYGSHDLNEGLPLLHFASRWLLEACKSRESFEAINAYLHRFLHVHGNVIAMIEKDHDEEDDDGGNIEKSLKMNEFRETLSHLRAEQRDASNRLQGKMQHTICLLRHLSRMV